MIARLRGTGPTRTERRGRANKHKEGVFFDSGQQGRMWRLVAALVLVIVALIALYIPVLNSLVALAMNKAKVHVFAVAQHDDGRTTVIGEIDALGGGDASEKMLQYNATKDIELTQTVTAYDQMKRNKATMLNRTADGSLAEEFVRAQFDHSFAVYTKGHVEPQHIDCALEGRFQGAKAPARFDCFYYLTPANSPLVTGANGGVLPTSDDRLVGIRYESHVTVRQSRGTDDPGLLYDNPDEVYLVEMTKERLPQ